MKRTNGPRGKHAGPNPGVVAIVYTFLFVASLSPVVSFSGGPHFPGPWESSGTIAAYFQGHSTAVLICAFLQFGAAIPLGIFTATMVSRLQFLGVRALYYLTFSFGGVGFSVPLGLLIAGICIPAAVMKLFPRWLVVFGLALAFIAELSALSLLIPQALFLIPLTRFPGFVWLIAAGFLLPKGKSHQNSTADVTNPEASAM
jgi:hypothetical protein